MRAMGSATIGDDSIGSEPYCIGPIVWRPAGTPLPRPGSSANANNVPGSGAPYSAARNLTVIVQCASNRRSFLNVDAVQVRSIREAVDLRLSGWGRAVGEVQSHFVAATPRHDGRAEGAVGVVVNSRPWRQAVVRIAAEADSAVGYVDHHRIFQKPASQSDELDRSQSRAATVPTPLVVRIAKGLCLHCPNLRWQRVQPSRAGMWITFLRLGYDLIVYAALWSSQNLYSCSLGWLTPLLGRR